MFHAGKKSYQTAEMSVFNYICLHKFRTNLILFCLFIFNLNVIFCFNLETRLPITKFGNPGSYFGYSVASHKYSDGKFKEFYWLLVGAPLDQNLQPGTNRSGALWKCPLTTYTNDCQQVVTDGKRNTSSGLYKFNTTTIEDDERTLFPPYKDEIKDGQWLGASLQSGATGKVIVCAHRYIQIAGENYWGNGLCYILTKELSLEDHFEPCRGKPSGHEYFGFCQAGTSSLLLDDDTVLMGSPGPYSWRGNVFVVSASDNYLTREKEMYHAPDLSVEKFSYLGMSVTAAQFFDKYEMVYAAGAPRANDTGQVVLFSKHQKQNPKNAGEMVIKLVLNGDQFASSFGYQVTNADVNGDGKPDLIVGAPFYFTKDAGGAVYVFLNSEKNDKGCLNCLEPTKLTGKPESRFGFSLSNLGDLNGDRFEDLAVGAPYENRGVVYIYLGSKNGLITEPSQIIEAEDVYTPSPVRTFGYSLSPGVDLDKNNYPDLLIGAYDSDAIILLRARPIIQVLTTVEPENNLKNIDPTKHGCSSDLDAERTCFNFKACCKIKSSRGTNDGDRRLTLRYKLEAETFNNNQKFSRIFFGDKKAMLHIIEKDFVLRPGEQNHCQEFIAYIKENTKDIQTPVKMKLSYSLVQREPGKIKPGNGLQSVDEFPILNKQQADKVFQATFQKDCKNNDVCESELHVEADLQLKGVNESYYELLLGQHQEVLLNVTVHNLKESAYEAYLSISHHINLSYIGLVKTEGKQSLCNPHNSTMVVCPLGNPLKSGATNKLKLRFDPHSLGEEPELEFTIFANTTSKEENKQNPLILRAIIVRKAELSLRGTGRPEQVLYGGEVKPVSSIHYLDEVGTRIMHTYQVFNAGPWRVSYLEIHIDWPYQVASNKNNGKQLLYIEDVPDVEALGGGQCKVESVVNPLNLFQRFLEIPTDGNRPEEMVLLSNVTHRVRREVSEMIVRAETYTDKDGQKKKIVNMDCLLGTAKCFKIICTVYNLQPNHEATISIRARLWNSTLVEDYPHVDSVNIASRAKIHIPPSLFLNQDITDDVTKVQTVAIKKQEPSSIPWWPILLAIFLGLLALILVILCLWKIGFFKRRRYDPTLSGNIEKHTDEDFSDDDY